MATLATYVGDFMIEVWGSKFREKKLENVGGFNQMKVMDNQASPNIHTS